MTFTKFVNELNSKKDKAIADVTAVINGLSAILNTAEKKELSDKVTELFNAEWDTNPASFDDVQTLKDKFAESYTASAKLVVDWIANHSNPAINYYGKRLALSTTVTTMIKTITEKDLSEPKDENERFAYSLVAYWMLSYQKSEILTYLH